mmetsp:Transcript_4555/g.12676  ORF Transcript_4555/g.12676 Transcript_4555/m.12676 type:complete len:595 (+) Transcript_4555:111-1895(+)|eukprot:CAMPEP_0168722146 /NCGR_PEP_ID=MMETSP0724-20121128/2447_1 /TAXON_ID=265536 /ORGANISM="Amphiprora sp., Strain CCMP467" /LENGTH=594 /DNA_ID=CAMNT_0008768809 /DNA_START=41 /DNA_END=1825 /DNA_ORIENTATION=-
MTDATSRLPQLQRLTIHYVFPPLFVSWRMYWANRLPIMDCDEVYNYWEPLHFWQHGWGMQTWEYAHEYALRTYAYLWPLQWLGRRQVLPSTIALLLPSNPLQQLLALEEQQEDLSVIHATNPKLLQFHLFRAGLAATMAICEVLWLGTICQHLSPRKAFWTGCLLLTGAGMNHAAAALLPSSTWIMAYLLASSLFLRRNQYSFCVVAVTATLTIGWPFGVVTCVPMGLVILWNQWTTKGGATVGVMKLLSFTALVTVMVQAAVMWIDKARYGRWTSATLNIFTYNAAGGGDELYGVEPASYYVKNLLLNWNIVAPLGLCVLPLVIFSQKKNLNEIAIMVAPLYLWLAITVPRPHKEERFLFPIYPMLCLAAVKTVDTAINWMGRIMASLSRHKEMEPRYRDSLHALLWIGAMILAISRTVALQKYYSAPLAIYSQLNHHNDHSDATTQLVCTCGEWYRFPGSYFLPESTRLGFLPSSFNGQLPQPFTEFGSRPEGQALLQPFNDQNLPFPGRFVTDPSKCRWIVDLEDSECFSNEVKYNILARRSFLDSERTAALHRVLYLPYLHERAVESGLVHYHTYVLAEVSSSSSSSSSL